MAKAKQNIAAHVRSLIEDTVKDLGYELWDVEYVKDGGYWTLRITIDSENGIDINDCEKVNRAIDPIIDRDDPIEDQYYLEVSSPGIERELRTTEHLTKFIGSQVTAKLFTAHDGVKALTGELAECDEDSISLVCDGKKTTLDRKIVSRVTLYYDFDNDEDFEFPEEKQ